MRPLLLALALALTGCATMSHAPGTLPEPVTLAEVNRTLESKRATVYFADGREPERWYVEVAPHATRLTGKLGLFSGPNVQIVQTSEVARIEIDDSLSPKQGALNGFVIGASPGAIAFAAGLAISVFDEEPPGCEFLCITLGEAVAVAGVGVAITGGVVGLPIGAATTAKRHPVMVYQAPVTRYPDAALALLDAAPLAEPEPTVTPSPEAAER